MGNFTVALRLRGGLRPEPDRKEPLPIFPEGIAMLLVAAVERSSRLYAVMAVRGYSGSMAEKERRVSQARLGIPLGRAFWSSCSQLSGSKTR